jgi:hypothetical protein
LHSVAPVTRVHRSAHETVSGFHMHDVSAEQPVWSEPYATAQRVTQVLSVHAQSALLAQMSAASKSVQLMEQRPVFQMQLAS